MGMKKKGIFFSIDSLIALLIIFLIILIAFPLQNQNKINSKIDQDLITIMSSIKIGELDNAYVQSLIYQGVITNLNSSLLEQIGELFITNETISIRIADEFLSDLKTKENFGIWLDTTLVASKNTSSIEKARQIDTSRQIISGIKQGENITGFSARAFMSSALQNKYFYFGGYVGDGNISLETEYNGNISLVTLEIVINDNFDLYVNDVLQGAYIKSPNEFTPVSYSIPTTNFASGKNLIKIKGNKLHIAGGFIKISYQANNLTYPQNTKQPIPGINGAINLYDGLTIPGDLNTLKVVLNLNSNATTFMKIGNSTIFQGTTIDNQTITLGNSFLSGILNYNSLSQTTTPIRIGTSNVSNNTIENDVISVIDLSYSMHPSCGYEGINVTCCLNYYNLNGTNCIEQEPYCVICNGTWQNQLESAKNATHILIDSILNSSNNRIGLTTYKDISHPSDNHALSTNKNSLHAKIDTWQLDTNFTCICCGVNAAINELNSNTNSNKTRSMIVLSDGDPTTGCWTSDPINDTITSACNAYNDHNITVHTVTFGTASTSVAANMQAMATCGNGNHYFADISNIASIYQQLAINILFNQQTIDTGDFTNILFPNSYIEFNYSNGTTTPFGLIATIEKKFTNTLNGQFNLPGNSTLLNALAVSYSGSKWTSLVKINSFPFYDIDNFGNIYTEIGDPYSIKIPNNLVTPTNLVEIETAGALGASNSGSDSNKIIYTIARNISVFSPISTLNMGCVWTIQFEDDTNHTISIPSNYSGSNLCYYQSTGVIYNINDAIQTAAFNLLSQLDIDSNQKIDIPFTSNDIQIELSTITGIPFPWSTEMQVRKWV
jgi:hypothetical protein